MDSRNALGDKTDGDEKEDIHKINEALHGCAGQVILAN